MKKIFYIALFLLTALVMTGCDEKLPFSLEVKASGLRESIVLDLKLVDPDDALAKSEILMPQEMISIPQSPIDAITHSIENDMANWLKNFTNKN